MRTLFGIGTPKGLQAYADLLSSLYLAIHAPQGLLTSCLNALPARTFPPAIVTRAA